MLLKCLISISLCVCVTYAEDTLFQDDCLTQCQVINTLEKSSCEDKITAALSVMNTENNHRLDALEINIPANLQDTINRKLYVLENKTNDKLEEYLDQKLYKLEKRILDKLEEYVDEKLDSLKNNLDELNKKIPNNLVNYTDVSNFKINALEIKIEDLSKMISYQLNTLTNKTSEKEKNETELIYRLEKELRGINNNTFYCRHDVLDKKINGLEEKLNQTCDALKKMLPSVEENINHKLNTLNKELPKKIEEDINRQFTLEKTSLSPTTNNWDILMKIPEEIEQKINHKLDIMQKMIPDLEGRMNNKLDALESTEKKILDEVYRSQDSFHCKEREVQGYNFKPLYRIDNETLNHVQLTETEAGVTYFEMHIAIKAAKDGIILLSPVLEPGDDDNVFEIAVGIAGNKDTDLRLKMSRDGISYINTPNILSSTHYVAFYIKIANGKIEFGKEGSNTPLISHSDINLKSVKYFGFGSWDNRKAKFLYDC